MELKVVIHNAEEGGYWAEVPSSPGCATQGESFEELLTNLYEAVEGCLSVEVRDIPISEKDKVIEITHEPELDSILQGIINFPFCKRTRSKKLP